LTDSELAWIGLALLPKVRPTQRARLLEAAGGPLELFESPRGHLAPTDGIRSDLLERVADHPWREVAEREVGAAEDSGIHILTPDSNLYPARLLSTPDPPAALWVRGETRLEDELAVAVVGSRAASSYGLGLAQDLASALARSGIVVVSGAALGIDGAAHRGALGAGGRTLAVLGCGIDVAYPRRHRRLLAEIAGHGAVLSEYPRGTPPEPWRFPERNRLIAGLALGTVVVEAGERSGALGTARMALDLGREVWAAPGRTTSRTSVGTNALLRDGAAGVARGADDVIADLPHPWREMVAHPPATTAGPSPTAGLAEPEASVLARIGPDEPVHVDALARDTRLPVGALLDALVGLEVRGLIRACPGGSYLRSGPPDRAAEHRTTS
jgi:DNA processing protein